MSTNGMVLHETFMTRCLELAMEAKAKGATAVGSVIVRNGEIIAEGWEGDTDFPVLLAHAEVIAVTKATERIGTRDLSGCTLYTTVEPCFMCSFVIREAKIEHVVYGIAAGNIGGHASNHPILTAMDVDRWAYAPDVTAGVLAEKCKALLKGK